ncbi:MAG: hypothetical protein KatS3mg110_1117 [Pirellulaceae bacterium]|nr:MAG: hypothetical protein KatS3mg110_1117 [Pirellulaceae bacterium]
MWLPLLSEEDTGTAGDGSIDPLGMYAIADALAIKLVPGVRERQQRPRFLTATAVSLYLCSFFDPDELASDGVSEPWQVFEWYLVEGLVRTAPDAESISRLPGRDKAAQAVRDNVPLSAARYLKTPNVFGFHAVYRALAKELRIEQSGQLGETGYELLCYWADEQGLSGFVGTSDGEGRRWRELLLSALRDGLAQGAVARGGQWQGWQFFRRHLLPGEMGKQEAVLIRRLLAGEQAGLRSELIRFLVSSEGQRVLHASQSERCFHEALKACASPELAQVLEAILAYESFARLLEDAFLDCLCAMTRNRAKTPVAELARCEGAVKAAEALPELYPQVVELLSPFGEAARFQDQFSPFADRLKPVDWVVQLLRHHRRVQSGKPPNGKSPWVERFDDGSAVVRPQYRRTEGGFHDGRYVHQYRTWSLVSFARDLRML